METDYKSEDRARILSYLSGRAGKRVSVRELKESSGANPLRVGEGGDGGAGVGAGGEVNVALQNMKPEEILKNQRQWRKQVYSSHSVHSPYDVNFVMSRKRKLMVDSRRG